MGTKKISELEELETLNDDDLIPIVDSENEATRKMTASIFFKQIMKRLKWKEIARYTTVDSNTTLTIDDLEGYTELLVTVGAVDRPTRILGSIVIPMELFLAQILNMADGYFRVCYMPTAGYPYQSGISYRGNNQITLYNNVRSNIVVYAR